MFLNRKIKLGENEEVVAVIHRYPLARWWLYILGVFFLSVTAFFTFWLFSKGTLGYVLFVLGLLAGLYILVTVNFFEHNNYLAVTSDRLVDVSRTSWFHEIITSIGYLDLKEVLAVRRGIFPTLLHYGTVTLTTRDNQFTLEIERVKAPHRVQAFIMEQKEIFRKRRREESNEATFHGFVGMIPELTEAQSLLVEKKVKERLAKLFDSARGPF